MRKMVAGRPVAIRATWNDFLAIGNEAEELVRHLRQAIAAATRLADSWMMKKNANTPHKTDLALPGIAA